MSLPLGSTAQSSGHEQLLLLHKQGNYWRFCPTGRTARWLLFGLTGLTLVPCLTLDANVCLLWKTVVQLSNQEFPVFLFLKYLVLSIFRKLFFSIEQLFYLKGCNNVQYSVSVKSSSVFTWGFSIHTSNEWKIKACVCLRTRNWSNFERYFCVRGTGRCCTKLVCVQVEWVYMRPHALKHFSIHQSFYFSISIIFLSKQICSNCRVLCAYCMYCMCIYCLCYVKS